MAIKQLNPYLNFDGTAAQAIKLYERALGAKTETVSHFGDMASAPEHRNRVTHALLRLGDWVLMISDTQPGRPLAPDGNVHICLNFDDVAEMTAKFEALSEGGRVTMPLQDTFWGAKFGLLTDAYGIQWMFNCDLKPS